VLFAAIRFVLEVSRQLRYSRPGIVVGELTVEMRRSICLGVDCGQIPTGAGD